MTTYTAVVSHDTGDDPETQYMFYADGYVLASGGLADCLTEAMSFGNNCNPQEGARVHDDTGYIVWRYAGTRLVRTQFRGMHRQDIDQAIAEATAKGWAGIGEREF